MSDGSFRALIDQAHRTRGTRARAILDDCLERLPHYQNLPEAMLASVRESILHHLGILYRVTLETGRPLSEGDLAVSRETARVRASQGVPLGEFLTFFLVGLTRAWDHLIESAGEDPDLREQLLARVSAVISNQTQLMTALTESYVEERERRSRFRDQDIDELMQLLFTDDAADHVIAARAKTLGVPLDEDLSVALFGPLPAIGSDRPSVAAGAFRDHLAPRLRADLWAGRSRHGFVALLPGEASAKDLAATCETLLGAEACVGVGNPGCDVAGLRRSARQALRALGIGLVVRGADPVHRYAEVDVLDLVGVGSADAEGFARDVLGPLALPDAKRSHLETLRQLCAHNHSIKLAAAALEIHPHTLSYRVKQLRSRFGLDLDDPEVRLRVHLALRILDARREHRSARPSVE